MINDYSQIIKEWYQHLPGRWLLEQEQQQLNRMLAKTYGQYVVQLGGCIESLSMSASPVYYKLHITGSQHQAATNFAICSDFRGLPLLPGSVDVILMMHLVEFIEHPTLLLKEAYDALVPGGKLLILAFNPLSVWGLSNYFRRSQDLLGLAKLQSRRTMIQWLCAIGFEVFFDKTFCFHPPWRSLPNMKIMSFLEAFGQLCCPAYGGVYLLASEKQAYRPVSAKTLSWRKPNFIKNGQIARPTTRV